MKKTLKLLFILLLVGVMAFSLVGCGGDNNGNNNNDPVDVEDVDDNEEQDIALDSQEVLMEAAKAYFDHIAAGNNNMTNFNDIKDMLDDDPNSVLIIDIRSAEDFEEGHIPGSVHSTRGKVGEIMDRIPRNIPVIIACYTGQNAGYTTAYLRMAGFDNVTSLFYGINLGWIERGEYELEGEGMVAAADLPAVSEPRDEEEEIIWDAAKAYSNAIDEGEIGFIGVGEPQEDFYEMIQADPNSAVIYDIRRANGEEHDYDSYHIEGAVHVAWGQFGEVLENMKTTVPVAVACYSGQTSAQTLGVLRMLGYDNARSILYGVRDGWVTRSELPVVTP